MSNLIDNTSNGKLDNPTDVIDVTHGGTNTTKIIFPIVGIGASAGGLEAITQFLSHLPDDTGMAFVVVQHLDPVHDSKLTNILAKSTSMVIQEAMHGMVVKPNHVYVITPATNLTVNNNLLQISARAERGLHLPIDLFLKSLAEDRREFAIGVILSGTGSDGTLGLEEIKAVGGITFAQDESSAKHPGMPQSAIKSGCVDFVYVPEDIARELIRIGQHPYLSQQNEPAEEVPSEAENYQKILVLLRAGVGVDFSAYRDTTIKRRIMRRMALHTKNSLSEYVTHLQENPNELHALFQDVLINVTSFFREPETFEALKESVFPEILKTKNSDIPIRIWAAGCSTGQEAYSIAIAISEFLDDKPIRPKVQVFATDLNDIVSLDKARTGVYPENIEAEVSQERLRRFFTKEPGRYRVNKSLRDMCVFAKHNVATDPPFSHLDLISCRNLLIYLSPPLQKRVIPLFHYALNSDGFLTLGASESVGAFSDLFGMLDKKHRIYSKKTTTNRPYPHFSTEDLAAVSLPRKPAPIGSGDWQREADRVALKQYEPPGVLINDTLDILHFRGETKPYLTQAAGEPSHNFSKMAREGLFFEVRAVVDECRQKKIPVLREGVRVYNDGMTRGINLRVLPIRHSSSSECCFLVSFEDVNATTSSSNSTANNLTDRMSHWLPQTLRDLINSSPLRKAASTGRNQNEVAQLQQELASAHEYLQLATEQQDAANEELKSANEEILSGNEELQSTNEELETAKEELQSINEELTTVNEQLQSRNHELNRLNDDMVNLLGSSNVPMVAVGIDLCIRRITPAAQKLLNVVITDVGRPIDNIKLSIEVPDLGQLLSEVIETVQVRHREVRDKNGHYYEIRIHPYRTVDNRIDGAVIVLLDIHDIKTIQNELLHRSADLMDADVRKNHFLAMLAHELRNPLAPIRNAIELMKRSPCSPTLQDAHDVVERQVKQLTRLIDDLLDVARINSGKVLLKKEHLDLGVILAQAVKSSKPLIDALNQELTVTISPEPMLLEGDPARLSQIFCNLLNNASKYGGDRCQISLSAVRDGNTVLVRVRDSGIGIAPEMLHKVFDLFMQVNQASDRSDGGLGIGLTLVRSLVELHGGTIEAYSAGLNKGSEFTVCLNLLPGLPAQKMDIVSTLKQGSTASNRSENNNLTSHRILVVDDNIDFVQMLAYLLKLQGHEVFIAHDGPSALEKAKRLNPGIIFLDIGLPKMDGHEVAREIRKLPGKEDTILVAITGYGQEEDLQRSLEAGFNSHLVKPVDFEDIEALLSAKK